MIGPESRFLGRTVASLHLPRRYGVTIIAVSRKLGKTPIVVKSGPGFLVNRLLAFTMAEAMWLLDEGLRMEDLDKGASAWGMPMGPCALTDEVGRAVCLASGCWGRLRTRSTALGAFAP